MTAAEFERLRQDASAYGEALGVAAVLRMVNAKGSGSAPSGPRIMLRVFRFVPGATPHEYSAAHGYRPDAKDLKERIEADISTAAEKLRAIG